MMLIKILMSTSISFIVSCLCCLGEKSVSNEAVLLQRKRMVNLNKQRPHLLLVSQSSSDKDQ